MISIKSFLDKYRDGPQLEFDLVDALKQMGRLLLDGIATHVVRGRESDCSLLRRTMDGLARQLEGSQSSLDILSISSDAIEALETYCNRTTEYRRAEKEQRHPMVATLTDTLADISGQTNASADRLQDIEKDLELASGLNDVRAILSHLDRCLLGLREAAAQQRRESSITAQRLRDQLEQVQQPPCKEAHKALLASPDIELETEACDTPAQLVTTSYVAAFKLKRADYIATRFGEAAKQEMLSTLGKHLKVVTGPDDRLLRWKGTSFVMFINSAGTIAEIRAPLYEAVAKTGMQHIEVGKRSALLAVGVDWIVFPQSEHASLESVFEKVDAFMMSATSASSSVAARH